MNIIQKMTVKREDKRYRASMHMNLSSYLMNIKIHELTERESQIKYVHQYSKSSLIWPDDDDGSWIGFQFLLADSSSELLAKKFLRPKNGG